MAGNRGSRHRSITLASAPRFCRVCANRRRVRLVALPALPVSGGGEATCPHCSSEPGQAPIPIYDYVLREDHPRNGDAA